MSKSPVEVTLFSDALCVWAYIGQIRIDELQANFQNDVSINYRFLQVFGDVSGKMAAQWGDRGGLAGYAAHVQEVAAEFPHLAINPQAWVARPPTSSLPAHLLLCAVSIMQSSDTSGGGNGLVEDLLKALRHAFFVETIDISNQQALFAVAEQVGIDLLALRRIIDSGAAHAQLAADLAAAAQSAVRASPTLVFNEGRQMLAGNVGYRVIEANIRELLLNRGEQQSWC